VRFKMSSRAFGSPDRKVPREVDTEADDLDLENAASVQLDRQISPSAACRDGGPTCRLVDCGTPAPTANSTTEAPRLEFQEFRRHASVLIDEFFCSRDVDGMVASVAALASPSFHDELAAQLLRAALDRKEAERTAVVDLLGALVSMGHLTDAQLVRGFEKLVLGWEDLRLDVPGAPGQLVALLSEKVGLLSKSLFARMPEDLLRLLQSELTEGAAREALAVHLEEMAAFKTELRARLEADLFRGRSVGELTKWLRAADKAALHHEVVLGACLDSLVGNPNAYWMSCFDHEGLLAEKRGLVLGMLGQLNSAAEGWLLDEVDIQLGFSRLLGAAEGIEAAQPGSAEHLVALLAGAVERELLPAEFLKSARRLRFGGERGVKVLRAAQRQTPLHSRRAWGSGDARHFREEVREAILEFFDSRDVEELAQITEELHLSEKEQTAFVRKLLATGVETGESEAALRAVSQLLGRVWSAKEVRDAFEQLRDMAEDWVLDFPQCREHTTRLVSRAADSGLLERADVIYDGITIV
jgi:hypothetical protein